MTILLATSMQVVNLPIPCGGWNDASFFPAPELFMLWPRWDHVLLLLEVTLVIEFIQDAWWKCCMSNRALSGVFPLHW